MWGLLPCAGRLLRPRLPRHRPSPRPPPPPPRTLTLTPDLRTLTLGTSSPAGHNKWSKVKHIKGPKDEARSRVFMKLSLMIKIAVKEGGPNPQVNVALAQAVDQARGRNMPKASIEAAIRGAAQSPGVRGMLEARGPGGCLLLLEVLTDNNTRTQQEVKHLLSQHGGVLCEGARGGFEWRGVVRAQGGVASERALELAVEAGAQDVMETQDEDDTPLLLFVCDVASVSAVRAALEERGVSTLSAGPELRPSCPRPLPPASQAAAHALRRALQQHAHVVHVWDDLQG